MQGYGPGVQLTRTQQAALTGCEPGELKTFVNQRRITSWPYYSKVKFVTDRLVDAPGFTFNLAAGVEVRAFNYAVGEQKLGAGFTAADGNANISDTNIIQRSQTIGGQNVQIHGIALQLLPAALHLAATPGIPIVRLPDARFVAALWENVSVEIALNADENRFRLGTIGMVPGAGGLSGGSEDASGSNEFAGSGKNIQFATNGWGVRSNFFRVPEGLIWRNQSNADSNLNIVFRNQRQIQLFSGGSPENLIGDTARDNAVGNVATAEDYSYPTELVVEVMAFMIGEVVGARTRSV